MFGGVRGAQSLVFCVKFSEHRLFLSFFLWALYYLSFLVWLLNTTLVYSNFS